MRRRKVEKEPGAGKATVVVRRSAPPGLLIPASQPSEYERILAALPALLSDVPLADLSSLPSVDSARETQTEALKLAAVTAAQRMEIETGLPAALFYGWWRQGLPTDPDQLFSQPTDELRKALHEAVREGIVPKEFDWPRARVIKVIARGRSPKANQ